MPEYKPLEAYGVIGNLETCALVGRDGSIDWCCLPHLNSSSIFAAILDAERGGRFAIAPTTEFDATQQYVARTNVLRTTFRTEAGTATVTDFMPLTAENDANQPKVRGLYRRVTCSDGSVDFDLTFEPAFDYVRAETTLEPFTDGIVASGDARRVLLSSPVDLDAEHGTARGSFSLAESDSHWFVLQYGTIAPTDPEACEKLLDETARFWRDSVHSCDISSNDGTSNDGTSNNGCSSSVDPPDDSGCRFAGYGHDVVVRSELVLKLLVYQGTGGITAAPTTSLPEEIGGIRNWDYRYNWVRDGAFTIRAFANLGDTETAEAYLDDFLELGRSTDPGEMQPLYGLQHGSVYEEEELSHLAGYEGSEPVRIGNEAGSQLQLGIYGDLVLAIYQLTRSDRQFGEHHWNAVRDIVEYVRETWDEPDAGIWEMRSGPKQFVHSKTMCWVALDRGVELAEEHGFEAPTDAWRDDRDRIEEVVVERGFDEAQNSFTQAFDDDQLDASTLLIPLVGMVPVDDDRVQGTIDAITDRLATEDGLVYRYERDDLPGAEGAFVLCSFWLVECLALAGRTERARDIYENILSYASPLGLISEEIDPETGRLLGNFPQAFSHIGLVNSALYLHEAEEGVTIEPFGSRSG